MLDRRQSERRSLPQRANGERRRGERRARSRRGSRRIPVQIWVEEVCGNSFYMRRATNISEGGLLFDVALPTQLDTAVRLRFSLPGQIGPVVARGRVARIGEAAEGRLGMAIAFTDFEGDGQERVNELIRTRRDARG